MKLKLDENLGNSARQALESAGHDVSTVPHQRLQAALDDDLIQQCKRDGRDRQVVACGDPHEGFARIYCDTCLHEFLLA